MEKYKLADNEVINFSKKYDNLFGSQLRSQHAWSRVVSLAHFKNIIDQLKLQQQYHVGIISGTPNEPELKFLQSKKVSFLSFEENSKSNVSVFLSKKVGDIPFNFEI